MELKYFGGRLQIKSLQEDGTFEGYASVFGNVDSWGDVVDKGAFKRSLSAHRKAGTSPKMLWQHNSDEPIGVYPDLKEDDYGLFVKGAFVLEVQRAREAYALLKANALDGLSIGYIPKKWKIDNDTGIRTLTEIELWEVSPVTFPANDLARVSDVKASDRISTVREFEEFLRKAGFSDARAKAIAVAGFKANAPDNDRDGVSGGSGSGSVRDGADELKAAEALIVRNILKFK